MTTTPDNHQEQKPEDAGASRNAQRITLAIFAAFAVVVALVGIDVALISSAQVAPAQPVVNVVHLSGNAPMLRTVDLSVSPGIKPGPGGKLHDAFSVTNFTVRVGQPVKLVIDNTDTATHSITSAAAGVNIVVRPGVHTYTLVVRHSGRFAWMCTYPCDPYSMSHFGYMRGYITAVD